MSRARRVHVRRGRDPAGLARGRFLVWARSRQRGSTCRAATASRSRSPAAGRAAARLPHVRPARGRGVIGIQWGLFVALLSAGALIVAGARVRAVHAPEPPNPAADDIGWVARPARERERTPERRPRDATAVTEMLRDRPAWEGERPEHPLRRGAHRPGCRDPLGGPDARRGGRTRPTAAPVGGRPRANTARPRSADEGGVMNSSAASIYQIDERGLELRRSYMRMTAAEFELLGGMQDWAERNADAIGKALAEHTFTAGPAGRFLREYANAKGIRVEGLKKGWGSAQAGHFKDIFSEAGQPERLRRQVLRGPARRRRPAQQDQPAAEVVPRHLSRLHRPRPRRDARRRAGAGADGQEGRFGRRGEGVDHQSPGRRRARA